MKTQHLQTSVSESAADAPSAAKPNRNASDVPRQWPAVASPHGIVLTTIVSKALRRLLLIVAIAMSPGLLRAQTLLTFDCFNTGVLTVGAVAPAGSVDLHYAKVLPDTTGPSTYVSGSNFPFAIPSDWIPNSFISKWITPTPVPGDGGPNVPHVFRTTFDLSECDPNTATLSGRWAADDFGSIELNGLEVSSLVNGYTAWTNFTITDGFVGGINTLDFIGNNPLNVEVGPIGLRVEFTECTCVPEPSVLVLAGGSFIGLLARRVRRESPRPLL